MICCCTELYCWVENHFHQWICWECKRNKINSTLDLPSIDAHTVVWNGKLGLSSSTRLLCLLTFSLPFLHYAYLPLVTTTCISLQVLCYMPRCTGWAFPQQQPPFQLCTWNSCLPTFKGMVSDVVGKVWRRIVRKRKNRIAHFALMQTIICYTHDTRNFKQN